MTDSDPKTIDIMRVVVNSSGEAMSPQRAKSLCGVTHVDHIFVRGDGWVLACLSEHYDAAYGMWSDEWVRIYNLREPREL